MPDRIVRAGIITSESVNSLGWPEEVFYRRLMNAVDDYGRFDGRPSILRATLYPLKLDRVSERDVETWLRQCEKAGLVTIYSIDGKQYLEVRKFDQRLRAKHSKYPPPSDICQQSADTCQHMLSNATESESESNTDKTIVGLSPDDMRLAEVMHADLLKLNPKFKPPNLKKWANTFRLMREIDNRTPEEIEAVWEFANSDSFWSSNVLSPEKLRKQFDQLSIKRSQPKTNGGAHAKPGKLARAYEAYRKAGIVSGGQPRTVQDVGKEP